MSVDGHQNGEGWQLRADAKGKPQCVLIFVQVADPYFEVDQPRSTINGGQDLLAKFTFKPPSSDPILKDIGALKGIGQWVESIWDLKLQGGFIESGMPDPLVIEIVLRAYVQQI